MEVGGRPRAGAGCLITLTGLEVYDLLQFLEHLAVQGKNAGDYDFVRSCVLWAERFREQAKQQGF